MFETNVFGLVDVTRRDPASRVGGGVDLQHHVVVAAGRRAPSTPRTARPRRRWPRSASRSRRGRGVRHPGARGPARSGCHGHVHGSGDLPAAAAHRGYEQLANQMLVGRRSVSTWPSAPPTRRASPRGHRRRCRAAEDRLRPTEPRHARRLIPAREPLPSSVTWPVPNFFVSAFSFLAARFSLSVFPGFLALAF